MKTKLFILLSLFTLVIKAQDSIVFTNKKFILVDVRTLMLKYDIIQVPQYQDDKLYTYNYWVYEIDHITTSDTAFVRMVYKKEPQLLYLFGYVKNNKIRYYEYDVVRDENKYAKRMKEIKDSTKKAEKALRKSEKIAAARLNYKLDSTIKSQDLLNFKWALKTSNSIIYSQSIPLFSKYGEKEIQNRTLSTYNFSVAFMKRDKFSNIHEFESGLLDYKQEKRNFPYRYTESNYETWVSYQFQYILFKKLKTRIYPYVGNELKLRYSLYERHAVDKTTEYINSSHNFALGSFITLGAYYFVNKKFAISFEFPFILYSYSKSLNYERYNSKNFGNKFDFSESDFSELFPEMNQFEFKISASYVLK